MILESYFDGGNEANAKLFDRITLATVCGDSDQWRDFISAWNDVLHKHAAPFLHTTDAVSLQGQFSTANGWDKASVDALIMDCVTVVEEQIFIPAGSPTPPRNGFYVITLSILLNDYQQARGINPQIPNSVTEICASESLGFCFKRGAYVGAHYHHLYFDQGEPFYGHVYDRMHNRKSKKEISYMEKVAILEEANMRMAPPLQLADLFAWCINHNNSVSRNWHHRLHSLPWASVYLDRDLLLNPTKGALERTAAWKLPKRKQNP